MDGVLILVDKPYVCVIVSLESNVVVPNGANHILSVLIPELCMINSIPPFL